MGTFRTEYLTEAHSGAQIGACNGSHGSRRPVAVSVNPTGSHRPWTQRLFGLAAALMLCFTALTGTLNAQTDCLNADVNNDGVVDDADLLQVLFCFGTQVNPSIDALFRQHREKLVPRMPTDFLGVPLDPTTADIYSGTTEVNGERRSVNIIWLHADDPNSQEGYGVLYLRRGKIRGSSGEDIVLDSGFYGVRVYQDRTGAIWADLYQQNASGEWELFINRWVPGSVSPIDDCPAFKRQGDLTCICWRLGSVCICICFRYVPAE